MRNELTADDTTSAFSALQRYGFCEPFLQLQKNIGSNACPVDLSKVVLQDEFDPPFLPLLRRARHPAATNAPDQSDERAAAFS
jgi:hypothetical protein